jgi:hypothetical protein
MDHAPGFLFLECDTVGSRRMFREIIDGYHSYKRFTDMPTRRIGWLVKECYTGNIVGAVGISSATAAIKLRDDYIGWTREQRLNHLRHVANNSRFCLVKARITVPNAGSQILRLLRFEGPKCWKRKYGDELVMLETFVDPGHDNDRLPAASELPRNGAIYRADNWVLLGMTGGYSIRKLPMAMWKKENTKRGRLARENPEEALKQFGPQYGGSEYAVSKSSEKLYFIRPCSKRWRALLTGPLVERRAERQVVCPESQQTDLFPEE